MEFGNKLVQINKTNQEQLTKPKLRKEALRESEELFRSAFDYAAIGMAILTLDGRWLRVNRALCEIVGYSEAELLTTTWKTLQHPDDMNTDLNYVQQMLADQIKTYQIEKRFLHKERHEIWVCLSASLMQDDEGNSLYLIGQIQDITERKQAELALQKSESRFHKLAANIPGAIYIFVQYPDGCTSFEYMSPACKEIMEVEPELVIENASLCYEIIHPDDRQDFFRTIVKSAETLECFDYEWRIFTPSGKLKWLQAKSQPERRDNGEIVWYGALLDISTRKQTEEALRQSEAREREKARSIEHSLWQLQRTQSQLIQSEKMSSLGQIVAGIAHEINNPISFIYCNIEPAKEYAQDLLRLVALYQQYYPQPVAEINQQLEAIDPDFIAEDFSKLLASMKEGTNRISKIVTSLKNFCRLDEHECRSVDIHEGIDNTLMILEHRLKQQSKRPEIQVIKEYGHLPLVQCYPGKLNQVFMNIINNAIDAIEESFIRGCLSLVKGSGQIKICTEIVESNLMLIRITDNGFGIKTEVKPRIFDPFFTTKAPGKGTGLGLSISYEIVVEKHGGQIRFNSVAGEMTEMAIWLPILQKNAISGCV